MNFTTDRTTPAPLEPKTDLTDLHRQLILCPFALHPTSAGQVWAGSKTDPAWPVDSLDTTHSKEFEICLLASILDLVVQESIILWLPCINSDKNLAKVLLPSTVACVSSKDQLALFESTIKTLFKAKIISMHITKECACIDSSWVYVMSLKLCTSNYSITLLYLSLLKWSMSWT